MDLRGPSAELTFEAAWSAREAVCVRSPRYLPYDDQGRLREPLCWSQLPRCDDLSSASGALLGVDSAHESLDGC